VATARAEALAERARVLLEDLRGFVTADGFDPARCRPPSPLPPTTCSATCCCRRCCAACAQAPGLSLRVMASGVPRAEMLRDGLPAGDQPAPARRARPGAKAPV
jgi:hypothetical protein